MEILFPPGRFVGGSLYKLMPVTDNKGQPKTGKDGKPQMKCSFGVAYRKTTADWKDTDWGRKMVTVAQAAFVNGEWKAPAFAWKVTDGDSDIPNKKGNKPRDNEGWAGNWVVWFSGSWLPKLCDRLGTRESVLQYADGVERIKPGHMIEVFGSVVDNKPSESPGVYVNFDTVAHNDDTTPVIALRAETDPTKVGFGGGAPAASAPPVATPPLPGSAPAPATPAARQMTAKAAGATYEAFASKGWTDEMLVRDGYMLGVTPDPAFLGTGGAPSLPPAPTPIPPAAPAARVMTAKAAGATYEAFTSKGWTDEMLVRDGYMNP